MLRLDFRDALCGGLLMAIGAWVAWQVGTDLEIGTARRMGPGFFPLALGLILVGLGLIVFFGAFLRQVGQTDLNPRALGFVVGSLVVFVFLVPYGLLPAVAGLVLLSSLADADTRPLSICLLAVAMCAVSYLLFIIGLGLPLYPVRWPH